jgi:hypothetical protein
MIGRENRNTRRKPAPVPLCTPQTPHAARARTRAAAVGSQRLTAELRHGPPFTLSPKIFSPLLWLSWNCGCTYQNPCSLLHFMHKAGWDVAPWRHNFRLSMSSQLCCCSKLWIMFGDLDITRRVIRGNKTCGYTLSSANSECGSLTGYYLMTS